MDKERLKDVQKYIDKYYIPDDDDIDLEDSNVRGFFDKIKNYRERKKKISTESCFRKEENTQVHEFDLSTATRKEITRPAKKSIVSNRKIEDLMSQMDETFSQRLLRMISEREISESDAYKKAHVDRRHFFKIKKDENYAPNKKTVLAFAVALELSLDETKDLLRSAGYALSRSSKFDIILVYFIENKIYDIFEINDVLYEYNQPIFEEWRFVAC